MGSPQMPDVPTWLEWAGLVGNLCGVRSVVFAAGVADLCMRADVVSQGVQREEEYIANCCDL